MLLTQRLLQIHKQNALKNKSMMGKTEDSMWSAVNTQAIGGSHLMQPGGIDLSSRESPFNFVNEVFQSRFNLTSSANIDNWLFGNMQSNPSEGSINKGRNQTKLP